MGLGNRAVYNFPGYRELTRAPRCGHFIEFPINQAPVFQIRNNLFNISVTKFGITSFKLEFVTFYCDYERQNNLLKIVEKLYAYWLDTLK